MEAEEMVLRQHRRKVALALALAAICSAPARGLQKNSVVGSVKNFDGEPLADVAVTVAQAPSIQRRTRHDDGLYGLVVPDSLKKFDLIFDHPNYLKAFDRNIMNRDPLIIRNVVVLTPKSPKAIAALSEQDLDRLIGDSYEAISALGGHHAELSEARKARQALRVPRPEELTPLARAGLENLAYLLEMARLFAREGMGYVRSPRLETAEKAAKLSGGAQEAGRLLRQALAIQERLLSPQDRELADTLQVYAEFLWGTGQRAEAEKFFQRAEGIRKGINNEPATAAPAGPPE